MLGPEIEGEVAQVSFGHNGLASAAVSTPAADGGSRSIGFQFHPADVIDAARTRRASGTSMLLSLLEMALVTLGASDDRQDRWRERVPCRRYRVDRYDFHGPQRGSRTAQNQRSAPGD